VPSGNGQAPAVTILRIALTTPCPVPVTPDGRTLDEYGEAIPLSERTELCAVDAEWMIGAQRCCDVHLAAVFEMGALNGTFEELIEETFAEYGEYGIALAKERMLRPWEARKRYSQDEARSWHESAQEHGLA
jgi:hypothetical protein